MFKYHRYLIQTHTHVDFSPPEVTVWDPDRPTEDRLVYRCDSIKAACTWIDAINRAEGWAMAERAKVLLAEEERRVAAWEAKEGQGQ